MIALAFFLILATVVWAHKEFEDLHSQIEALWGSVNLLDGESDYYRSRITKLEKEYGRT